MACPKAFGEFAKSRRMALGLSLREFCRQNSLDWGNLSRMERGLAPPPKSRAAQERYAQALDIKEGSEDWITFLDLASICSGQIPEEILEDRKLFAKLPLVFRTIKGQKLSREKLHEIAEIIRKA